jgi:CheY-like chemotaxis protein
MIGKLGGELAASPEGGWQFTLPAGDPSVYLKEETDMQDPTDDTSPTNAAAPPVAEQLEFAEVTEEVGRKAEAAETEAEQSSASEPTMETDNGNSSRDGKETILVVEDEEMVRDLVKRSLGYLGYDVLDACNGEEGLEVARRRRDEIDMVFSDIVMPRMSGPEMVAKMVEEKIELPVLYTTGFTDNKRLLDNGEIRDGVNLLPKPYTTKVLAARVREVLDTARR